MAVGRGERRGAKDAGHRWEFKARFRRNAFGWRSQPAVQRVEEAVGEIKRVAQRNPVLAADGAVTLLERISPALEAVDSSSGSIGTAVHNAIEEPTEELVGAPAGSIASRVPDADAEWLRDRMLARLEAARQARPPEPVDVWAVSERYRGIEHARVAVVNISGRASGSPPNAWSPNS